MGFHTLLQVIFSTQGSNPGLPHCRWIIYQLSHQRSPLPIILTRPLPTMSTGPLSTSLSLFLICKQVHLSQLSRFHACVHAKSLQSCPTPCDPMDQSPPYSSVHRILQARILQWVAMPSSRASSRPRNQTCISYMCLHWKAGSSPLVSPGKANICFSNHVCFFLSDLLHSE